MHVEHHDLAQEFPEFKEAIHQLKTSNHHFARLFEDYQSLDKEICRMEDGIEPVGDAVLEERKKARLHVKDQLYAILRGAQ